MTKCRHKKKQEATKERHNLHLWRHLGTSPQRWSNHRLAGRGKQRSGGIPADMDISCTIYTYNERLSLTLMTTKLKYTETRTITCFHATATYLSRLLSCWWVFHTDRRDWCHENEQTFSNGIRHPPLANRGRICRTFGFIFNKRVVNKSCYSR